MAVLLVPDEIILDQSFPRSPAELSSVCEAFGNLHEKINSEEVLLLITDVLCEFVLDVDWASIATSGHHVELARFISQLILTPRSGVVRFDTSAITDYPQHDKIDPSATTGYIDFWTDEMGRILKIHQTCAPSSDSFIGIACTSGFSGGTKRTYPQASPNQLPIVCINSYQHIKEPLCYQIDPNIHNRLVSLADARRNLWLLNGTIEDEHGTSHQRVTFPGASRPWTITGRDPVPSQYVQQLEDITGHPHRYILHVLTEGNIPILYNVFHRYLI